MKTTPEERERIRDECRRFSSMEPVGRLLVELEAAEIELAALRRVEREGLYVEREAGVDEPRCWYVADGDYGGRADTLSDALVAMDYDAKKEQR